MYACLYVPGEEARARLAALAASFSPLFEPGDSHVSIDIRGLRSLMGSARDIAVKIAAAMQTSGLRGNVAVAANPHVALMAARGFAGVTVVAPGDEARKLAPLPLSLLEPEPEIADTLAAWGIRTFGELSKLPEEGLAERLGREGVRLHAMARGLCPAPIATEGEEAAFESAMELEYPLDSLEPLAFLLARLLGEICGRLVQHGLATNELHLRLGLEDRSEFTRTLRMPFASTDNGTFLKLIQYDLAAHPPAAAILSVGLRAVPVAQRRLQGGLFVPSAPEAEKLELTLARLSAIVGEGNVGAPELLNTHRPGAFRMRRLAVTDNERAAAPQREAAPAMAVRVFRPPVPAKVSAPLGVPIRISGAVSGTVVAYAGPWRTSGDWWRRDAWARDEWDVALEDGSVYRVVHEAPDCWYVEGNYD